MTTLTPNGDDDLIAEFMQQFEAATDKDAVVREFAERHPHLAAAFADYAAGHSLIGQIGAGGEPVSHLLKPGEMLGDFKVVRFLTHGGMGEIYEAEQIRLSKRRVALKVIRKGRAIPEARARFEREQAVLAKLHQTNIVPVFANGERGEVQYFAMQYIDGATLGHVVKLLRTRDSRPGGSQPTSSLSKLVERAVGPPTDATPTVEPDGPPAVPALTDEYVRSVVESLAEVAEALHAAHEAGVVHRDVKPSNLMAEKSGKCWVIDFGLAGLVGEAATRVGTATDPADPALTATGSVMGTYAYMAPEQFDGNADRRTDVWALGVTLYELLALDRPFSGPLHDDYKDQIQKAEPADLRSVSKVVPTELAAICATAMKKAPADRYPTAGEFAADLRRWLRHEPTTTNPPWVWRRMAMWAHRQPGWASMVGVAVAAALGLVGLALLVKEKEAQAASAEATTEKLRADAADQKAAFVEASASEAARQRARQKRIVDLINRARQPVLSNGWRDRLLEEARRLVEEEPDPTLRDRLAALLAGLDARAAHEFNVGVVGTLAFGPTDDRLLIAGYGPPAEHKQFPEVHLRNLTTRAVTGSSPGPVRDVAWRKDMAVQLVAPITRPTLEVCDISGRRLDQFVFPERFRPMPAFARILLAAIARSWPLPLADLPGPIVQAVALSADGTHAAALVRTARDTRSILVWRTGDSDPRAVIPTGAADPVHFNEDIILSADGSLVALGMVDGRVRVWDVARGPQPVATLNLGGIRITAMAFARHRGVPDPDHQHPAGVPGWLLAAGDGGGGLVVWDLGRLDRVTQARDSHHEVFTLTFSPDGETLYSAGRNEVRCWDVTTGRVFLHINPKHGVTSALAVSPSGARLGVASRNPQNGEGWVQVFDLESGRGIQTLRGLAGQVCRVTATPDQKRVAAMTLGFQVGVWDRTTGQLLIKATLPPAMYADHADVRLTDDGRVLIVASGEEARRYELPPAGEGPVRVTDVWRLNPAFSNHLAVTPDGTILLGRTETQSGTQYPHSGSHPDQDPRRAVIYRLTPGREPHVIRRCDDHPWRVYELQVVPDGSCFVVVGTATREPGGNSVVGYAGPTGECLWQIPLPKGLGESTAHLDCSGRLMHYGNTQGGFWLRELPYEEGRDVPSPTEMTLALGRRYRFESVALGVSVADFESDRPFLVLDPDQACIRSNPRFSLDGRWLTWGTEDGTVRVADLPRIRAQLTGAGFPGW